MAEKKSFETFEKRLEIAKKLYSEYEVDIPKDKENLAIQSLTMPQYAKEYNDIYDEKIYDNTSLATLGDAVCSVWLMQDRFNESISKEDLSKEKQVLENSKLNPLGEKLKESLFVRNNDLQGTVKSPATNFEAFIGFIYKVNHEKAFELLNKIMKKELN